MLSIPTSGSSQESQSSGATQRGLLGLLAKHGEKSSGGAESFSREVERAVRRQGGEQAVESRRLEHSDSRRSKRHASFGAEGAGEAEPRLRERDEPREPREAEPPIQRQVQASENRRAAEPRAQQAARESQPTDAPATSGGDRAPQSAAQGPLTSAKASHSATLHGAPVAASITAAPSAAAGAPAAANAQILVPSSASARPSDASQAFINSARAKAGVLPTKESAPTGSTPDPKLIEHAEKVLRQIRLNVRPGLQEITLNLKPVDLGRLSIDLRMHNGSLAAVVRAESPETLELLKHQAPELRAVLAQQGIQAEEFEFKLAFGGSSSLGQGAERQASKKKREQDSGSKEQVSIQTNPTPRAPHALGDGGIDTLA